jgi:hypothetical protein
MWDCVAPGGHLVVQDHDLLSGAVVPELDVVEEFLRVVRGTFAAFRRGHAARPAAAGAVRAGRRRPARRHRG